MDFSQLLTYISSGGIPVILFIIWYFTFKNANEQFQSAQENANEKFYESMKYADKRHEASIQYANQLFDDAARRYEKMMQDFIQVRKQEQHSKELMIGILSRLQKQVEDIE